MRPARPVPRRLPVVVAGLLASAAVLAGCTPADDAEQPAAEPAPGVTVPSDLRISTDGEVSRTRAASSPSPSPSTTTETGGETVDPALCAELQQAWTSTNRALAVLDPEHPRALVQSFRTGQREMGSVEPPAEVEPAWAAMSDYLGSAVTAFEDVDTDDASAVSSAMSEAISADDTAKATSAAKDVTSFLATSCAAR